MADWLIQRLARTHERGEFECGKPALTNFLRSLVTQYEKRRLGRTYVALKEGENKVVGYYTLAAGAVNVGAMPAVAAKKLPKHPVPVVLLARLAVDQSAQGQGLGGRLLADALGRCLALADQLGIHAIEVDAIDLDAKAFYEKFGFVSLQDDPLHMYLPIATVETASEVPGNV